MNLYEVATTRLGESYVRSYVWAAAREDAAEMFKAKYPEFEILGVPRCLFESDCEPFVSVPSDTGFEMPKERPYAPARHMPE